MILDGMKMATVAYDRLRFSKYLLRNCSTYPIHRRDCKFYDSFLEDSLRTRECLKRIERNRPIETRLSLPMNLRGARQESFLRLRGRRASTTVFRRAGNDLNLAFPVARRRSRAEPRAASRLDARCAERDAACTVAERSDVRDTGDALKGLVKGPSPGR